LIKKNVNNVTLELEYLFKKKQVTGKYMMIGNKSIYYRKKK